MRRSRITRCLCLSAQRDVDQVLTLGALLSAGPHVQQLMYKVSCSSQRSRGSSRACTVLRAQAAQKYDYDLVIVGAGVGGHGAAMHAIESVSHPLQSA